LVLFDPARVQDKATFTEPHQFSQGFDLVLVNGEPVVEDGKLTGARPGQILRHALKQ
jgi:N-acyl-D-aspartate/D-glutamate deacylase